MEKTAVRPKVETTAKALVNRFVKTKGTTFVGMNTTTVPQMNKTGNVLFGNVVKDSIVGGIVGADYANMVNNARNKQAEQDIKSLVFTFPADVRESMIMFGISEQEISNFEADMTADIQVKALLSVDVPSFFASERKWGKHYKGSKIVISHEKDGESRFYVQLFVLSTRKPTYRYADSGEVLSDTDVQYIHQYMPKKDEGARQGLRSPIIVRDYRIDNLNTITINKTIYEIKG